MYIIQLADIHIPDVNSIHKFKQYDKVLDNLNKELDILFKSKS